jgi:hypothetical protein
MKKIFTLLFAIGLVGSAFAQSDRRAQYRNQDSHNSNPAPVYQGSSGYNGNNQTYNHSQDNSYGSGNDRNYNQDRRFEDRRMAERRFENGRFYRERNRRFFWFRSRGHGRW